MVLLKIKTHEEKYIYIFEKRNRNINYERIIIKEFSIPAFLMDYLFNISIVLPNDVNCFSSKFQRHYSLQKSWFIPINQEFKTISISHHMNPCHTRIHLLMSKYGFVTSNKCRSSSTRQRRIKRWMVHYLTCTLRKETWSWHSNKKESWTNWMILLKI